MPLSSSADSFYCSTSKLFGQIMFWICHPNYSLHSPSRASRVIMKRLEDKKKSEPVFFCLNERGGGGRRRRRRRVVSCRVVSFRPPSVPAAAAGLCDAVSTWGSSPSRSTMGISASSLLDETKSKNVKGNEPRDSVHRKLRVVLWRRVLAAIVESMKKPHVFLGASPESEKSEPVHQTGVSKLKKKPPISFTWKMPIWLEHVATHRDFCRETC